MEVSCRGQCQIQQTPDDKKAAFVKGWIGDKGVHKCRKFDWLDN